MRRYDLAIYGFGLIPGLLTLHLLGRGQGETVLLLSGDRTIGGETLEPVLTASLSSAAHALVEPFVVARWPGFFVRRDGTPHEQMGEVLLLDPMQVWLELQGQLGVHDMVCGGGAVQCDGTVITWTDGEAQVDDFIDLSSVTYRDQAAEIIGIDAVRSLTLPVLVDFDTGSEPWDAFQHIPLGDERVYVRKRRCRGDPVIDLTAALGKLLSDLIAY